MDSAQTNGTSLKSCLKRSNEPASTFSSQNDDASSSNDEINFHFTDSSAEEESDSDSATNLPHQFVYHIDNSPCADYRRIFSMNGEERKRLAPTRKPELGPFFPPKHPDANSVRQRYEYAENFIKKRATKSWKDSVSSQKVFKFDATRKKINIDAIREKYIPKQEKPQKASFKTKTKHRVKNPQPPPTAPVEDFNDDDFGDANDTINRLQEEYLATLPSTSLPRTTPAFFKSKNGTTRKPTPRESTFRESHNKSHGGNSYFDKRRF